MAFGFKQKKDSNEINKVVLVDLNEIISNPNQPRKHFDPDSIQELSRSIVANGLLQPVTLRKRQEGGYELIAGERRTLAFRSLGRERIPAIITEYTDQQSAVLALIENLQRKDLNYFEEAAGVAKLMEQLNLSQMEVSARIGKAQSTIANKLRLLKYPQRLRQKMLEAALTERHARAFLKLEDMQQIEFAVEKVIEKSYNVQQTEQLVERMMLKKELDLRTRLFVVKDVRMFKNSINKAVALMSMAGIPVEKRENESDEFLEYHIRIPKSSAYCAKTECKKPEQTRLGAL